MLAMIWQAQLKPPSMMVPVQLLDGLAADILSVVVPNSILSLLRGSAVCQRCSERSHDTGGGATMSPALTGVVASHYSFAAAFSVLSIIAFAALIIWWRYIPVLSTQFFIE